MADNKMLPGRCAACGAQINRAHGRVFCEDCAKARQAERNRTRSRDNVKKPKPEPAVYVRPRRTGRMFDLSGKDLAEVDLEAKTLGMTYGQYTAACAAGTIEQKLMMQGISREEATRLVKTAKRRKTAAKKKKAAAL